MLAVGVDCNGCISLSMCSCGVGIEPGSYVLHAEN